MLELKNITKDYRIGSENTLALNGVSIRFGANELASILGPSGGGKTTLLNIIGGLDRYTNGDLLINGKSTKDFSDSDWDAYRNNTVGFIFQTYNLIPHLSVLDNVAIALSISGVSGKERKERAAKALEDVGLKNHIHKKPNQLSGGQMQRVAIARALVNNPKILLADEPTGALDSRTSVQIMKIIKEISKDRLVIMVTHNAEIADEYSDRIINIIDGQVTNDSKPPENISASENGRLQSGKTSMSFVEAVKSSFKNLLTKKGRTIITAFAGSIGIIGVALVLALSTGLSEYMNDMQSDTLSGFPITVSDAPIMVDVGRFQNRITGNNSGDGEKFPEETIMYRYDNAANTRRHLNILTQEYFDYISEMETAIPGSVNTVVYTQGVDINLLAKGEDSVVKYETEAESSGILGNGNSYWQELPNNEEFILSLYDLVGEGSRLPSAANEIAIVVDEYNRVNKTFFEKLGFFTETDSYEMTDFMGKTILKVIPNNSFYTKTDDGIFVTVNASQYGELYENADGMALTVTGILRIKESASSAVGYLSKGIVYTTALTDYIVENAEQSEIAHAQRDSDVDVILNVPFTNDAARKQRMCSLGADTTPTGISIYPKDFESKDKIIGYLNAYNENKEETEQIIFTDMAETVASMTGTLLDIVSYVLIGFASISLVVSTIMIGIITYVSVLERTKEIGILRSVGARKKDISRVFNAEALIIGFAAGILGIVLAYLLTVPANFIIYRITNIRSIADLPLLYSALLVLGSMALTLIAGFFPSKMAAKKDPVVALRTE